MATSSETRSAGSGVRLSTVLASNEVGLALVIIAFIILFAIVNPGFTSPFNLYALSRVMGINMVIGFAMMVVLVTGGLNLALGSIGVAAAMAGGWLMQTAGIPWPLGAVGAILAGAALGWINGALTVRMKVHSFIVTLATMSIFFGAMIVLTRAEAFNALPKGFVDIGKIRHMGVISVMLTIALLVWVGLLLFFHQTAFGRQILAGGANPRAAGLSGVPVDRTVIACHTLSGALGALAGLMLTVRNGAALPSMAGHIGFDWLLPAFIAPVLGGTLLTGGVVSVTGTLFGAALVTIITNGLLQMQIGEFWVRLFLGIILLTAVVLDRLRGHLAEKRRRTAR